MQPRFGFIPSPELAGMIDEAFARAALGVNNKDPMYPKRNALIEKIGDELVDSFIIKMADEIDDERADQIRKLGNFLQKTVNKIVKVMLSKDKDEVVMNSISFLRDSVARDNEGNLRVGAEISQSFYDDIIANFETIKQQDDSSDNQALKKQIAQNLKKFDNLVLEHFLLDFVDTLNWGAVKRGLAKGAKATISGANGVLIEQMVPRTSTEDLRDISPFIEHFFFQTDEPAAYPE